MHAEQNATKLLTEGKCGQRSKTKFTQKIWMSFINLRCDRNHVMCLNKMTKVEHVFNHSDVMAWIMSSVHGIN
jgi:hypothetical protein